MRAPRWPFLILILTPFILLFIARVIFGFNGLYGQDAHRYYQFSLELEQYFSNGIHPGDFRWPVLYPLSGLLLKTLTGFPADLALQLLSTIALAVSGWFAFKILLLKGLHEASAFLLVMSFLILCPQLVVGASLCMSDMYGMMWLVLTWYCYFRFRADGHLWSGVLVGLFSALAVFSRYPVFFLIAWPAAHTLILLMKRKNPAILLFITLAALAMLPELLLQDTSKSVGGSYLLNHWSLEHLFSNTFETVDGVQKYRFINLVYISYPFWHPAFFLALLLFALINFSKLKRPSVAVALLVSVGVYLLFLGGIPLQNRRFFLPSIPLIFILLAPVFTEISWKSMKTRVSLILAVILQITVSGWYFKEYLQINQFERQLAADMQPYQGNALYAFYWDTALKSYSPGFQFYNLWEQTYQDFVPGDLVLFNPEGLQEQWEETAVMQNWDYLQQNYSLTVKEQWPNGWKLYEVR